MSQSKKRRKWSAAKKVEIVFAGMEAGVDHEVKDAIKLRFKLLVDFQFPLNQHIENPLRRQ